MVDIHDTLPIPTDSSQFIYQADKDYVSPAGNLHCEFYLYGKVLLLRLIGSMEAEGDVVAFEHYKKVVGQIFPREESFYLITDATDLKTIGLEVRRTFFGTLNERMRSRKSVVFGVNKNLAAMLSLGARYVDVSDWLEVVPDFEAALHLIRDIENAHLPPPKEKPGIPEREATILDALMRMMVENEFDEALPDLAPDDPYSGLFLAVSSMRNEFKAMQAKYDEGQRALKAANLVLDAQVKQQSELLVKSEENYRLVVETATDGILIISNGVIRYANPQVLTMLRYSIDEIIGQPVERFVNPGARQALTEWAKRHGAGEPVPTRYESAIFPKYGKPVFVEIHATQMTLDGEICVLAFVRDMTHRKLFEEAERTAREISDTLREIGELLGSTLKLDEVTDRMVGLGHRIIPYDTCVVYMVNNQGTITMRKVYNIDQSIDPALMGTSPLSDLGDEQTIDAIRKTRQPLIINNMDSYPGWVKEEWKDIVGSWLGIPLLLRNGVRAIISLTTKRRNYYNRTHAKNAQLFGHQASLALDNAFLYDEAQKRINELSILNEIGQASSQGASINEILNLVYRLIKKTFNIRDFCAHIYLQEIQELESLLCADNDVMQDTFRKQVDEGLFKMLIETRRPLLLSSHAEYEELAALNNWVPTEEPFTSWMGVPMIVDNQVFGLMATKTTGTNRTFRSEDLSLFHTIATHLSIAIENVQLDEQMQQYQSFLEKTVSDRTAELEKVLATMEQRVEGRTQELTALYTTSLLINRMTNLSATLQQLMQVILPLIGASSGAIHIYNNESKAIERYLAPHPLSHEIKVAIDQVPRQARIWDEVVKRGNQLILDNLAAELDDCPCKQMIETTGLQSFIGLPIHGRKNLIGMLSLYKDSSAPFNTDDSRLLSAITDQIGLAIENDHLRRENERAAVEQERQRLARDLHDSVSQLLYSQVLYSNAAKKGLSENGEAVEPYLDQLEQTSRQALREMRLMIFELRSNILDEEGLASAIRERIETVEQRSGLIASLNYTAPADLPDEIENELYFIVLEALNNVLKHSKAQHVHINLGKENDFIILEIADDGVGFDPKTVKSGMGLTSMRERANRIGGVLQIQSDSESGTRIIMKVRLPEGENDRED